MSAMFRPATSRGEMEDLLNELTQSNFHSSIKKELDIVDVEYEIRFHPFRLIEGFLDLRYKASAVLNANRSKN